MLSLQYQTYGHFCGASLITMEHALTAAHCMFVPSSKNGYTRIQLEKLILFGGATNLEDESFGEKIPVNTLVLHREFNPASRHKHSDIAVLKLAWPFSLDVYVAIIPLALLTPKTGSMCNVTGWGTLGYHGAKTKDLMKLSVPISDYDECKKSYRSALDEKMICAGYPEGGKDSCQGDSGGPLVCGGLLCGVVSFGNECAKPGFPGVYTSVAANAPWIQAALKAGAVSHKCNITSLILITVLHLAVGYVMCWNEMK